MPHNYNVGCQPGDCIWSVQFSSGVYVGIYGLTYSLYHPRGAKRIHTDSPNHTITLENTKILSVEHKWFERGVKEAIHIRALKPSLNRDGGQYNLPPI